MLDGIATLRQPFATLMGVSKPSGDDARQTSGDIRTAERVDLSRFSGDWYVIACIPTLIEKDACNAMDHYRVESDGTVAATYRFRKGEPGGRPWTIRRRGIVRDTSSNAVWDLKFAGPITADYRIVYVNEDYSEAIVGRNRRDYAWILARTPSIPNRHFFEHVRRLREQGYDSSRIRPVPQDWSASTR